ncbi:MAG: hypothetical protein HGA24_03715 [Candidatus Aminicenantes bacterium]|nr:hypothetical protein [Candidatus Aminicenantes bacterium]
MGENRLPILCISIFLLLVSPSISLAAESQEAAFTPPKGSAERKLILDALRSKLRQGDVEIVFVVRHLKVKDGWAWVHILPQSPDGASRFEDVSALLKKDGAGWKVVELPSAEVGDAEGLDSPDYFLNLKKRFPNLPPEILPESAVAMPAPSLAGRSILDCYHSIPEDLLGDHKYRIEFKNDSFVSRSVADYEIKPHVDLQNGYLKIVDRGTGGGSVVHELAFLRTNEGTDIIGVNLFEHDGLGPTCTLRFYKLKDGQWMDVTNDVLPKVDLSHFLDEPYVSKHGQKMELRPEGIAFVYELDIVGAPFFVKIDLDRFLLMSVKSPAVTELIKNIKYQNIRLIWDKEKNVFDLEEKALLVPSELMRKYLK